MMTPWRPHWQQQSGDDKVVKGAWTRFCWAENPGKDGKIRFESTLLVGLNVIFQVQPVAWGVWRQFRCEEGATAWNLEHDTPETWDWKGMVLQSTGNGTFSKLMKRVATWVMDVSTSPEVLQRRAWRIVRSSRALDELWVLRVTLDNGKLNFSIYNPQKWNIDCLDFPKLGDSAWQVF